MCAATRVSPPRPLTLALPKGRMLSEVAAVCARAGIAVAAPLAAGGEPPALLLDDALAGVRLLLVRPGDVWSYVAFGAADLGITGKDVLEEMAGPPPAGWLDPPAAVELADLGIGACRMAVAGPAAGAAAWPWRRNQPGKLRVATKYPRCTRRALGGGPLEVQVIPLAGSVELAPLAGLADVIVDLVATGRTLRTHGLVEYEVLFPSTARLIANEASLRLREEAVLPLVERLEAAARGSSARTPAGSPAAPAGSDATAAVDASAGAADSEDSRSQGLTGPRVARPRERDGEPTPARDGVARHRDGTAARQGGERPCAG
ncbi:MAG TPA: ATP phosphoribosyltransferase [Thermaerobacter sp.]